MRFYYVIIILVNITFFKSQQKVIIFDFANYKTKLECDKNKKCNDIYLKEKTILLRVKNYNPLRYNLTVNKKLTGPYHQTQPQSFSYFNKNIESINIDQNTNNIQPNSISTPLENFTNFHNSLVNLNSVIEESKGLVVLDSITLVKNIDGFVEQAKSKSTVCTILDCSTYFRNRKDELIKGVNDYKKALNIEFNKLQDSINNNHFKNSKIKDKKVILLGRIKKDVELYDEAIKKIDTEFSANLNSIIEKYGFLRGVEWNYHEIIDLEDSENLKLEIVARDKFMNTDLSPKLIGTFPIKQGFKISFSTGGFWTPNIYDEDFIIKTHEIVNEENEIEKKYTLNIIDGGKNSFGPMAFINFQTANHDIINWGAGFGVGLMFNDNTKLVFAPNLELIIGNKRRGILHVGYAFAQVKKIFSSYDLDYQFSDSSYNPILKNYFKGSFMLGFSYNLNTN